MTEMRLVNLKKSWRVYRSRNTTRIYDKEDVPEKYSDKSVLNLI